MPRVDVDQSDILLAVEAHLRQQLNLNESNCFISVYEQVPSLPRGIADKGYFLTVCPGEGTFDDDLVAGHPVAQLTEYGSVIVTIVSRVHLDASGKDANLLTLAGRGLMRIKRKVLRALCGEDLQIDGNEFLRELIRPSAAGRPESGYLQSEHGSQERLPIAWMHLHFAAPFDWDLSDD